MYRIFIPAVLIIASEFAGYYYLHDFSICATIFITTLLLFSWLFRFPEGKWLNEESLKNKAHQIGEKKSSGIMTYDKTIGEIIHDYVDLKNYSNFEMRLHDTEELIEDTQEAIVKTLIPYLLILGSSIFTYVSIKKGISDESYADLVKYKNFITLTYIGVAFCYIAWNISPLMVQKKKNKLSSKV